MVQLLDLGPHLATQLRVEVRQRLVEQERHRLAHHRAAHRHALTLAARELCGLALHQRAKVQDRRGPLDPRADLGGRHAAYLQREGHIPIDIEMRVERVILEHHGDVAVLRRQLVHHPAADRDRARGDIFQPRDHPQERGFPAAGWAHQDDELPIGDRQVDAMHDLGLSEALDDLVENKFRHSGLSPHPIEADRHTRHS